MKTPLLALALCAAPLAHGLSITALESDCVTLNIEVTYGNLVIGDGDGGDYFIPNSGILSFGVEFDGNGFDCGLWPDDVEEKDRFFLPLDFTTLVFPSVTDWISDYRVQNHGWGFTISYADEPVPTVTVPDTPSPWLMILSLAAIFIARKFDPS